MFGRFFKFTTHLFRKENLRPIIVMILVLGFAWFAIFGDQGLYQLRKSLQLRSFLYQETADLKKKIVELKSEKELLNNPEHLEQIIRHELGYVKSGEVVFQPIPEEEK